MSSLDGNSPNMRLSRRIGKFEESINNSIEKFEESIERKAKFAINAAKELSYRLM